MFQTHRCLYKDSSFFQHPHRLPRKPQSDLVQRSSLLHAGNNLPFLCGMSYANRTSEGSPNHLLSAARPAFIEPRIFDQDGQVVAAPVVARVCAGRTSRDVIPANLPDLPNMLQNSEFWLPVP